VIASGAACLLGALTHLRLDHPLLFVFLLGLASATSTAKIELPLGRGHSNLSFSQAIIFWALFALGPADATVIAAVSALAQCTLRVGEPNPLYRIVFSVTSLPLTVAVAGLPFIFGVSIDASPSALAQAAGIAAPLYFFANTGLVAIAIALSTRQGVAG